MVDSFDTSAADIIFGRTEIPVRAFSRKYTRNVCDPLCCDLAGTDQNIFNLRVATHLENMGNLENSGNLKNCQHLRENSGKFEFL